MGDSLPPNPNPSSPPSLPPPPTSSPAPQSSAACGGGGSGGIVGVRRPPIRVTSEFDSESSLFLHKLSCKLFDGLAKLKLSFQNDPKGGAGFPELGFLTKHFSVLYDLESRNALLKGSFDLADSLQVRATHDVKVHSPALLPLS
uniref:Uncharacterized protein n=1 Tax=Ananas comosus var. bracteatus TaxID=296719 RepID=A0A6V7NMW9_ANACO|nr:unnamed protein product [Ananas comosus var. bracteatus]